MLRIEDESPHLRLTLTHSFACVAFNPSICLEVELMDQLIDHTSEYIQGNLEIYQCAYILLNIEFGTQALLMEIFFFTLITTEFSQKLFCVKFGNFNLEARFKF